MDSSPDAKLSFLTSKIKSNSRSSAFTRLNSYEVSLSSLKFFAVLVVFSLMFKMFFIYIKGIHLIQSTNSCAKLFDNLGKFQRSLLVVGSVIGDNLPFIFIYYQFVRKFKVEFREINLDLYTLLHNIYIISDYLNFKSFITNEILVNIFSFFFVII